VQVQLRQRAVALRPPERTGVRLRLRALASAAPFGRGRWRRRRRRRRHRTVVDRENTSVEPAGRRNCVPVAVVKVMRM